MTQETNEQMKHTKNGAGIVRKKIPDAGGEKPDISGYGLENTPTTPEDKGPEKSQRILGKDVRTVTDPVPEKKLPEPQKKNRTDKRNDRETMPRLILETGGAG